MNKINLTIFSAIIAIAISISFLSQLAEKQKKVFIIGSNKYVINYDKSWREFLNSDTKNPSFYLTSFKLSDENIEIDFYRADATKVKEWKEYLRSAQQEIDGPVIIFKHGSIKIGKYNSDIWFVGNRECCESSLETMIKLNNDGDFIFAEMVTKDDNLSDDKFRIISKKFYKMINSIHIQSSKPAI